MVVELGAASIWASDRGLAAPLASRQHEAGVGVLRAEPSEGLDQRDVVLVRVGDGGVEHHRTVEPVAGAHDLRGRGRAGRHRRHPVRDGDDALRDRAPNRATTESPHELARHGHRSCPAHRSWQHGSAGRPACRGRGWPGAPAAAGRGRSARRAAPHGGAVPPAWWRRSIPRVRAGSQDASLATRTGRQRPDTGSTSVRYALDDVGVGGREGLEHEQPQVEVGRARGRARAAQGGERRLLAPADRAGHQPQQVHADRRRSSPHLQRVPVGRRHRPRPCGPR